MTTMSDKPTLAYGWWEKKNRDKLPEYLGHKHNYVMTVPELQAYVQLLGEQADAISEELLAARLNLRAVTDLPLSNWIQPRCTTLMDALLFIQSRGLATKKLLELLTAATRKRREAREAQERG